MRRTFRPGRSRVAPRILTLLAILVPSAGLAGCGASPGGGAAGSADVDAPEAIHVHGLGVDPADRSILFATHRGLFRLPDGAQSAARVGGSTRDMMGFTVVGPRRYLASGHPELPTGGAPPLLGLIASADGGVTWRTVSEGGRADFHVLRASEGAVMGWDSVSGRLFISDDAGKRWRQRGIPGPLVDLALHPERPGTVVAATERGIVGTADDGVSWRRLAGDPGLLAWPASDALFLAGPGGDISVSEDGGRTWVARSRVDGEPSALAADGPERLVLAMHDGTVLESTDAGATWGELTTLR
jgi:hypothetical protein